MKVLIIKLSSIGDVIHTLPAFSVIKKAIPAAEIAWVVEKSSAEILRGNPLISKLIEIDTKALRKRDSLTKSLTLVRESIHELHNIKYDSAIDFQGLLKSAMIGKISGAKNVFGFAKQFLREPASRFLLNETFPIDPKTNVIRKNIQLAEQSLKLNQTSDPFEFPIFTEEKHQLEAQKIVSEACGDFVILNPATELGNETLGCRKIWTVSG